MSDKGEREAKTNAKSALKRLSTSSNKRKRRFEIYKNCKKPKEEAESPTVPSSPSTFSFTEKITFFEKPKEMDSLNMSRDDEGPAAHEISTSLSSTSTHSGLNNNALNLSGNTENEASGASIAPKNQQVTIPTTKANNYADENDIEKAIQKIKDVETTDEEIDKRIETLKLHAKDSYSKEIVEILKQSQSNQAEKLQKMKDACLIHLENTKDAKKEIIKTQQGVNEIAGVVDHVATDVSNLNKRSKALPEILRETVAKSLIEYETLASYVIVKNVPESKQKTYARQNGEDRETVFEYFKSILRGVKMGETYVQGFHHLIKRVTRIGKPGSFEMRNISVEFKSRETAAFFLQTYAKLKQDIAKEYENSRNPNAGKLALDNFCPYPIERRRIKLAKEVMDNLKDAEAIVNDTLGETDDHKALFLPGQCRLTLVPKRLPDQKFHTGPKSKGTERMEAVNANQQRLNAAWKSLYRAMEEPGNGQLKERVLDSRAWKTQGRLILHLWQEDPLPTMQKGHSNGSVGPQEQCSAINPSKMLPYLTPSNPDMYPKDHLTGTPWWITGERGKSTNSQNSTVVLNRQFPVFGISPQEQQKLQEDLETPDTHKRLRGNSSSHLTPPLKKPQSATGPPMFIPFESGIPLPPCAGNQQPPVNFPGRQQTQNNGKMTTSPRVNVAALQKLLEENPNLKSQLLITEEGAEDRNQK